MEAMQVVRVVSRVSARESWTVLGEDDAPVAPVERFLAYLTDVERSPNTVIAGHPGCGDLGVDGSVDQLSGQRRFGREFPLV